MKNGKSLSDFAAEIERQAKTKRDFVARTEAMQITTAETLDEADAAGSKNAPLPVRLRLGDQGLFPINAIAHDQIAEHVGIPKVYYKRMLAEAPDLLANNVNRWFTKYPAKRMVRTLDERARAFLSDAFQPLDNYDFGHAVLPILAERKLEIMSCELTERRLYIKAVDTQLFRDVPVGHKMGDGSHTLFDTCAPAIILSNSEVGFGRLVVETGVYTRACTNLALFASGGMKRTHVGARHALTDGMSAEEFDAVMSNATKRKSMEALWGQVHDVIKSAFDEKVIGKRVEQLNEASGLKITGKVEKVVEVTAARFDLNDGERESIFKHLIEGGQLTKYGLHSAITRAAQDVESYDRATELEYLGGKIIELPANDWARIAEAA